MYPFQAKPDLSTQKPEQNKYININTQGIDSTVQLKLPHDITTSPIVQNELGHEQSSDKFRRNDLLHSRDAWKTRPQPTPVTCIFEQKKSSPERRI